MHRHDAHDPISRRMFAIVGELTRNRHGRSRGGISERYFTVRIPRKGRFIWVVGDGRDWIFPETELAGPDASWLGGAFFDDDLCPILNDTYNCTFFLADHATESLEPIHKSTAASIIQDWMENNLRSDVPRL